MLEDEFREASKITRKSYEDIANYYFLCKRRLDYYVYSEFEYQSVRKEIMEQALSYTRDYVWFDEKTIK